MRRALIVLLLTLLVLLPGCGLATELAWWLALTPSDMTLQLVQSEERPARDMYDLTERFKGDGSEPLPRTVEGPPPERKVGDKSSFWVGDIESRSYYSITATLRVVTDHAYFWVEDGYSMDRAALERSAAAFDQYVYPTTRSYFGSEWTPGVDGDPRIFILNAGLKGVRGYFSSADEFTRVVNPFSNEHEMIYIDAVPGNDDYLATLAHEFQHMIHWNENRTQDVWLNEGCAELSMAVNGYESSGVVPFFEEDPDLQLNAWGDSPGSSLAHYGASYLFFRYLTEHFGGGDITRAVIASPFRGPEAVTDALSKRGLDEDFDSVFERWVVANYVDERVPDPSLYGYADDQVEVEVAETVSHSGEWQWRGVSQYGADYIRLEGDGGDLEVGFEGMPSVKLTAATPRSGSHLWWSNRGDDMNTGMMRKVDLTGVSTASLRFWAWYDIEEDYDYAYVGVSTDGGRTWTALHGRYTTDTNPNGANLGNGYTGTSGRTGEVGSRRQERLPALAASVYGGDGAGGLASRASPVAETSSLWVEESIDLSPYAGRTILLRFDYVTDDGFNGEGLVLDDISIPEIGYYDDAESESGWTYHGFIRSNNVLPQEFSVQVLRLGEQVDVEPVPVGKDGKARVVIPEVGRDASEEVLLVVAARAPRTTQGASYAYSIIRD